jgi:hypothetical protein
MPVVIRTRTYDEDASKSAMGPRDDAERSEYLSRERDRDFPD